MLTGESIPVEKNIEDYVMAGTINKQGIIDVCVSQTSNNSTLAKIIKLVEEAGGSKAPMTSLVDKLSSKFVPVVLVSMIKSRFNKKEIFKVEDVKNFISLNIKQFKNFL